MTYGCHNRAPYKEPHRMSPNCEYTKTNLGQADARCVGCKWRKQNELAIPTTSTSTVDSEANQSVCKAAARQDAGVSTVNCKHRYEPTLFGIKYRKPDTHWWSCIRCGKTIFSELKVAA